MRTVKSISNEVRNLQAQLSATKDADERELLADQIDMLNDEMDEIEAHERDMDEQDELMGNTAQDRYLEQNHYAIVQSERYEQFRREH